MDKHDLTGQGMSDSHLNMSMDDITIVYRASEEEYEILTAREHASWMARKAEIVSIRINCNMHTTETAEEYMQYVQELQKDGYEFCEPYYDDCGYAYFQKRIEIP